MRSSIESNAICQPLLPPYPNEMNVGGAERAIPSNSETPAINRDHYIDIPDGPEEVVFKLQELPKDLSQLVISFVKKEEHSNLRLVSKQMRQNIDGYRMLSDEGYGVWLEKAIANYQARKRLMCLRVAKRIAAIVVMPLALPVLTVCCLASCLCCYCGALADDCRGHQDDLPPDSQDHSYHGFMKRRDHPCFRPSYTIIDTIVALFRTVVHGDSEKEL
jgi:hypothetical protein